MKEGVIIKGVGSFYDVLVGSEVFRCRPRGRFRKLGITPMVEIVSALLQGLR